jgi:DUF2945 family protein
MSKIHIGDHVRWNSEAGMVRGVIVRALTSKTRWKGYLRHASKAEPQSVIKSDTTDHMAAHKGTALRRVPSRRSTKPTGGTLTRSKRERRLPR